VVPAESAYRGIAPLPSRDAVAELIAPLTGAHRAAMDAATQAALRRLAGMLRDHLSTPTTGSSATRLGYGLPAPVLQAGTAAVDDALAATARGHTLADTDAAWLSAVLVIPDVRDYAWNGCDGSEHQRRLWIDMTRRATPATTPAPAFLLAVSAYLSGDGTLARIALDRCLRCEPGYAPARLAERALQAGVDPQQWHAATRGRRR